MKKEQEIVVKIAEAVSKLKKEDRNKDQDLLLKILQEKDSKKLKKAQSILSNKDVFHGLDMAEIFSIELDEKSWGLDKDGKPIHPISIDHINAAKNTIIEDNKFSMIELDDSWKRKIKLDDSRKKKIKLDDSWKGKTKTF